MPLGRFDLPAPLNRASVMEMQRANAIELYDQFVIADLFNQNTRLTSTKDFNIPIMRDVRTAGTWHAKPAVGDRAERMSVGMLQGRVLFQAYKDEIEQTHVDGLRLFNANAPDFGQALAAAARQDAARRQAEIVRGYTARCLRNYEIWACNMLSQDSFTLTIDGSSETVTTGLTRNTTTRDTTNITGWGTASTDIVGFILQMFRDAEEDLGGVTHVIYSNRLNDELAKNDTVRAVYNAGSPRFRFTNLADLFSILSPSGAEGVQFMAHKGHYDTNASGGTRLYFWPKWHICFLNMRASVDGDAPIYNAAFPTMDDDYRGGLFTKVWQENEGGVWVKVGHNGGPVIANTERIKLFDVE